MQQENVQIENVQIEIVQIEIGWRWERGRENALADVNDECWLNGSLSVRLVFDSLAFETFSVVFAFGKTGRNTFAPFQVVFFVVM